MYVCYLMYVCYVCMYVMYVCMYVMYVCYVFIIPLCSNKLQILNPYRGCSNRLFRPALTWRECFYVTRCALLRRRYLNKRRKSAAPTVYSPIFAYFHVISPYFRVHSVDKSYRKATIYAKVRPKSAKIRENPRKSAVVEYFW